MISAAKLRANRANARHSTGPKSPAGKARSARNAHRHGLASPARSDPALAAAIDSLALAITAAEANAENMALARKIAEAQIDLVRIQQIRLEVLSANKSFASGSVSPAITMTNSNLVSTIAALDRYERRTLSRRKTAIRDFDTAPVKSAGNVVVTTLESIGDHGSI
jgi:hypothetical protein